MPHYNEYLVRSLQQVRRELYGYVGAAELAKLEAALLNVLQPVPENIGLMAGRGHDADLRANSPVLRKALESRLPRRPVLGDEAGPPLPAPPDADRLHITDPLACIWNSRMLGADLDCP